MNARSFVLMVAVCAIAVVAGGREIVHVYKTGSLTASAQGPNRGLASWDS